MKNSWAQELRIGMTMLELKNLLGEPAGTNSGSSILGGVGNVFGFNTDRGELQARLNRTLYCVWRRPEGMYCLILVDGCLAEISDAPGYEKPKPIVRKGAGYRHLCGKCGMTRDEIVAYLDEQRARPNVYVMVKSNEVLKYCVACRKAFCYRCEVEIDFCNAGCPECKGRLAACPPGEDRPEPASPDSPVSDIIAGQLYQWESSDWLAAFGPVVTDYYNRLVPLYPRPSRDVTLLCWKNSESGFWAKLHGTITCHQCSKEFEFSASVPGRSSLGCRFHCKTPGCAAAIGLSAMPASAERLGGRLQMFSRYQAHWIYVEPETVITGTPLHPIKLTLAGVTRD